MFKKKKSRPQGKAEPSAGHSGPPQRLDLCSSVTSGVPVSIVHTLLLMGHLGEDTWEVPDWTKHPPEVLGLKRFSREQIIQGRPPETMTFKATKDVFIEGKVDRPQLQEFG